MSAVTSKTILNAELQDRTATPILSEEGSQASILDDSQSGHDENVENRVEKVAGIVMTPGKESRAERIKRKAEFTTPDARRVIAKQERYREVPHLMGVLTPSATTEKKVFITPTSVRTVSRTLGEGAQGAVVLSERHFNDDEKPPAKEALKVYSNHCESWKLMKEILPFERKFLNLPSKVYSTEDGKYVASLPLAESDLFAIHLTAEPCPVQKLLGWMRDVAEGIEVLHTHHLLHRDLKPRNILVLEGRGVAQAADLDLVKKSGEKKEHFTTCTPYYSHPSIWGNDIMKQKIRQGIQTEADDVFSFGRTLQYGVIGKVLHMHAETMQDANTMCPKKVTLPENEQEADHRLLELVAENNGPVLISGSRQISDPKTRSGYRYIPSTVVLFPSREELHALTLQSIEKLRGKIGHVEFNALRLTAELADELQQDDPSMRPSMQRVRQKIEGHQVYLRELSEPAVEPSLKSNNPDPKPDTQ
ncbi:MAG: protein kinase family protein [Chlamydiales bacterium]|nr:protein kinase family protein [Chlamydiales bacterium]